MDKGWKQFERRVSRDHGVERKPVSGRQTDKHGADNEDHPMFNIQCKLLRDLSKTVQRVTLETARKAEHDKKVGVCVWKEVGRHDDNAIVSLRYKDWIDLHGA